jgi:hypothetical protein
MLDSNEWIKFVRLSLSLSFSICLCGIYLGVPVRAGKVPCCDPSPRGCQTFPSVPGFSTTIFLHHSCLYLRCTVFSTKSTQSSYVVQYTVLTYFATWLDDRCKPNQVDRFCFPPYKRRGIKRRAETYREAGQRTCDFCSRRAGYTDDDDEERKKER